MLVKGATEGEWYIIHSELSYDGHEIINDLDRNIRHVNSNRISPNTPEAWLMTVKKKKILLRAPIPIPKN